jgi:hypothetical protein
MMMTMMMLMRYVPTESHCVASRRTVAPFKQSFCITIELLTRMPLRRTRSPKLVRKPTDPTFQETFPFFPQHTAETDHHRSILADEDNMEEIDVENIVGRRTRGKVIDFAKAAQENPPDEDDDEEDDDDFVADEDKMDED